MTSADSELQPQRHGDHVVVFVHGFLDDRHAWAGVVHRLASDIEHYIAELNELGVICKGMDTGLVDFRGELDGREVFYCWKLGEPSVQYWHEVDAGFVGRQRLHPLALTSN